MNKKLLWILCITIVIGVSFFTGFKVKNSFQPIPTLEEEKKINPPVAYSWYDDESFEATYPYFTLNINNLTDIETASDLILEVEPLDDGTLVAYSLLRECKVINTLKGNITENTVYLYENSYFYESSNYLCKEGYINMKKGENYIVFLTRIENSDKVEKSELRNGYIFTNPRFGKYKMNSKAELIEYDPDKDELYFNDIVDLPVLLNKQTYVDIYNNILSDVAQKYIK